MSLTPYIDQVHLYLRDHPSTEGLSAASIQDLEGMYFRKAVIWLASVPSPNIPDGLTLWTEEECVKRAVEMIQVIPNGKDLTAEFLQDHYMVPFRKRVLNKALDRISR